MKKYLEALGRLHCPSESYYLATTSYQKKVAFDWSPLSKRIEPMDFSYVRLQLIRGNLLPSQYRFETGKWED